MFTLCAYSTSCSFWFVSNNYNPPSFMSSFTLQILHHNVLQTTYETWRVCWLKINLLSLLQDRVMIRLMLTTKLTKNKEQKQTHFIFVLTKIKVRGLTVRRASLPLSTFLLGKSFFCFRNLILCGKASVLFPPVSCQSRSHLPNDCWILQNRYHEWGSIWKKKQSRWRSGALPHLHERRNSIQHPSSSWR